MNRRFPPFAIALLLAAVHPLLAQEPAAAPATFTGQLQYVRYDLPRGLADGLAPTRQPVQRKDGQDAVDWPDLSLNGQPLWKDAPEASVPLRLRKGAEAASPFRSQADDVIEPGGHWIRATEASGGRRFIYTADRAARSGPAVAGESAAYELWAFPVVIKGEGGPVIKNVDLKMGGKLIFHRAGPWRSLTLLLPASERGKPYELTVDGRGPVKFEAGLLPVKLGDPHERLIPLNCEIPGEGPKLVLQNLAQPEEFPHAKEWAADLAAMKKPLPNVPAIPRPAGLQRYLGVEVPFSPLTVYAAALPHGLSGGFFKKGLRPEAYAEMVASTGYDTVFEASTFLPEPQDGLSFERRAAALAAVGVRLGLQYDQSWGRPDLQHPNLALLSHTLPDWHAPLYRSLSLAAQRFGKLPNFAGLQVGSTNAGYTAFAPTALPAPERPWGEAMIELTGSSQPKIARAPSLGPTEFPWEKPVRTQADFIKFVTRYETSFRQYGYFAEAVKEADSRQVFTTAAFGSGSGANARGGWPGATAPGRVMFEGLGTQQAFDGAGMKVARPMQLVSLADRLRSYHPQKKTWALIDNHHFLYGREAWQRACALALTRGVQGVGTNFLANAEGDQARPDVLEWQKEMNAWLRKFGGVYAKTEPLPVIGIFYGHHQTVQRRAFTAENGTEEQLLDGSHEGKVTEALFLCHAAGWPARVITFQEMQRGPLPASMKAILLVGLDQPDETWVWSLGLEPALKQFLDRGGRILADQESVCPVPFTKTGMKVAAYVAPVSLDPTPMLLARNTENIGKLRAAMADVPPPVAVSEDPKLWAIPTQCGDTQYVTAINQAFAEGAEGGEWLRPADPKASKPELWKTKANASLYVKPQQGTLKWQTDRPVYDVRLGRKLTEEQRTKIDLTRDAFQWYALPPAEVVAPTVTVQKSTSGFYEAKISMVNGMPMAGIPVQVTVSGAQDAASVYAATGAVAKLPLSERDPAGDYTVTVTELLTGLKGETKVNLSQPTQTVVSSPVRMREATAMRKFAGRKHVALVIGLTPEQEKVPKITAQAQILEEFFRQQGRVVSRRTIAPGDVVESLQPLKMPQRYPQWKTVAADLVLFGLPANNPLMFDEARGYLFPRGLAAPAKGEAEVIYTRSAFAGEYDVVNVVASDVEGISAAVQAVAGAGKTTAR